MTAVDGALRGPNAWWVGFVCGMATFVDAAATTGVGIALVLFLAPPTGGPGLSGAEVGYLTAVLTAGVAAGSLLGGWGGGGVTGSAGAACSSSR
ncbi:hypothetical protein QKG08_14380 [Clavibacter michiganensis]|uniref:hypothetical protein n=2 Tax=Clavibacter michiganensis TaxID=28447 RepID=UPI0026DA829E|nr:hypothetical protein [Clavibacter michiganensis]MDO4070239.1 hypothetical protein [Clavibacter michiganensis]